jgi:hypothetical protein
MYLQKIKNRKEFDIFAGHNKGKYMMPGVGYVRGKKSEKISISCITTLHTCPFCGYHNTAKDLHKICGGCKREWFRKRNGDFIYVGYIGDGSGVSGVIKDSCR